MKTFDRLIRTPFEHALVAAALVAVGASTASAGNVTVFEGAAGGPGLVRVYDEATGALVQAPAGLQRVLLVPLEVNGRTDLHAFQPHTTRLRSDVPSANRALLPVQQGSIYHYARPLADGSRVYGFFQVLPSGGARRVFELPFEGTLRTTKAEVQGVPLSD